MKAIVNSITAQGPELYVHYEIWTESSDANHEYFIAPDQENPEIKVQSPVEISILKVSSNITWSSLEKLLKNRISQVSKSVSAMISIKDDFVGREVKL